jgi:broad specificity phosphatase PhoE
MGTLYLIRHGQASFGDRNYDKLSERGIRQMKILAEHLVATGCRIDAVYSGPLDRQKSSAGEVIRRGRELGLQIPASIVRPDLSEYDSQAVLSSQLPDMASADPAVGKDLQDLYSDEVNFQKVFGQAVMRWVSGQFDKPGVETWHAFSSKVRHALEAVSSAHEGAGVILVFTSGGVITAAVQTALGLNGRRAVKLGWQIVNASITRFTCRKMGLTLSGFNDIAHLELCRDRNLITYR